MKVWLFGLGLALLCSVLAVGGAEDVSINKMTGKWYAIAVSSNCDDVLDYRDNLKILEANIKFADGSFEISINIPMPGGCQKISVNFRKKESGHYFHESVWGDYTVEDYETDYKNWFAVKTKHETKHETCEMLVLYSRDLKMSKKEKDRFTEFCMNNGYSKEDIIVMRPEVACAKSQ